MRCVPPFPLPELVTSSGRQRCEIRGFAPPDSSGNPGWKTAGAPSAVCSCLPMYAGVQGLNALVWGCLPGRERRFCWVAPRGRRRGEQFLLAAAVPALPPVCGCLSPLRLLTAVLHKGSKPYAAGEECTSLISLSYVSLSAENAGLGRGLCALLSGAYSRLFRFW